MLLHLRRYHGRPFSWIAIISCAASLLLPNKACTLLALSLSSRLMIQRASLGGHRSSIVIFKITNVDVPSLLYMFMHQLSNMFLVKKKKAGIYLSGIAACRHLLPIIPRGVFLMPAYKLVARSPTTLEVSPLCTPPLNISISTVKRDAGPQAPIW